ncbi:MAG TPA: DNA polymerase I [Terriglobales bacterium]|nr:DNA polymerase I [Terriglobales bacterium]
MPSKSPNPPKPAVYLIDAMSFIFRAYHAMARQRPMSTRTGIPTAATYVFVNMLRKLRDDFSPQYLAAVFDVAAPTFRDQQAAQMATVRKFDSKTQTFQEVEYKGYKANRAEMPGDLAQQLPYIRRALEAYRIPILEMPGYEADDVIGTLARKLAERSHPVFVVSSDKDMLQLVTDKVHVLNPPKDNLICDPAKVEEILGVRPEQVVDVMALRGDAIDNIPGAPGIGDKGSVELIKQFGTVEKALERAAEVERRTYRESLQNNREAILLSKQLARIDTNVAIDLDLESMRAQETDAEAARALFTELEFTTLAKDFEPTVKLGETEYREAKSAADVEKAVKSLKKRAALAVAVELPQPSPKEEDDEEEEGGAAKLPLSAVAPQPDRPLAVAISAAAASALSVTLGANDTSGALKKALADATVPKALHDWKAAIHALEAHDAEIAGVRDEPMLFSYLLDPTYASHDLEDVALRRFNLKLSGSVAEAADVTGRLAAILRREVEEAGLLKVYDEIDLPLVPVLARMEAAGVNIDSDVLVRMSKRLEKEVAAKAKEIYELAGLEFNISSPKKLAEVLYDKLQLPAPVKYGKGKTRTTEAAVLEELALTHEVPRKVIEYRQLSKLKSTYVDALPQLCHPHTGRLHTTFGQTNTATGRLSSTDPNLQNIPIRSELGREIRAAFTAATGCVLLSADYSQIELRLLAHLSEDPLLIEAYRRGDDIHTLTASKVFGVPPLMIDAEHRRRAKAVNFGIVYGLSPFGLSQQLGIETGEAKKFISNYFETYKGVRRFIDRTLEECRRDKKVRTLFGRVRPIADIDSKNPNLRGFAERTAVNTPLQGTAADLIKIAMIRIDEEIRRRKLRSRMTLQVHDELVFEVPKDEVETMRELVKDRMENAHPLKVPLVVDMGVGPNWRDLE